MLNEPTEVSNSTLPRETAQAIGPGSRLRKIRETKHLSIDELAKRMRLTRERLLQIENDDYRLMGASAFAKGYIRSYAGQLGIAKQEVIDMLAAFDTLNLAAEIPSNKPQLIDEKIEQGNPNSARRIGYFLILLVVILIGYWWYTHATFNTISKLATQNSTAANNEITTTLSTTQPAPDTNNKAAIQVSPTVTSPSVSTNVPLPAQLNTTLPTDLPQNTAGTP